MNGSTETWKNLSLPWQVAFEEAWASFRAGSFGVGAVLTDPAQDDAIVTAGRNRVNQMQRAPRTLSGNMTAHAEMNAFAELDTFDADGLHLYTTLQPCLMCSATAMQLRVAHVSYAAADEFVDGLDELWAHNPVTADRRPEVSGPMDSPLSGFARLLPMIHTFEHHADDRSAQLARQRHPALASIADDLSTDAAWADIRKSGTAHRGLGHLWSRLEAL